MLLSIDSEKDEKARDILSSLIGENYVKQEELAEAIEGRTAIVFGAGPSLVRDLGIVKPYLTILPRDNIALIAADGASKALLERGLVPDIIVTDLDGDLNALYEAGVKGSILVVHGHGDNIDRVKKYVPLFLRENVRVHGTTQVKPCWNVFNYYGFTDGDRAVFLALHYRAKRILLAGMDLGPRIGVYSGKKLSDQPLWLKAKLVKLMIARRLLEEASHRSDIPLYTLSQTRIGSIIVVNQYLLPVLLRT